ncbi:MAG: RAMP superfamily CRISPR-associated protein [Candidatus Altarchaeaceae archaeon]
MTWKCYELKFVAISPIHIGYRKLGIINQTRCYIPGKTIWGAVSAVLARKAMDKYDEKIYTDIGNFVKEYLKFSYFYLTYNGEVLYPKYENGLSFGNLTKEEFENKFISSYVSTAVEPSTKTAEDGSLHEFEYIKQGTEFSGYLFANDRKDIGVKNTSIFINCLYNDINLTDEIKLSEIIKEIQVGGERSYGFGWLKLNKFEKCKNDSSCNLYNSGITVNLEDLTIKSEDEFTALSHVDIKDLNFESVQGDIEPFGGREWSKKGAGHKIANPKICLIPGTKFKTHDKIKIGEYGIWQKINE